MKILSIIVKQNTSAGDSRDRARSPRICIPTPTRQRRLEKKKNVSASYPFARTGSRSVVRPQIGYLVRRNNVISPRPAQESLPVLVGENGPRRIFNQRGIARRTIRVAHVFPFLFFFFFFTFGSCSYRQSNGRRVH